jgi:hypothetical protein
MKPFTYRIRTLGLLTLLGLAGLACSLAGVLATPAPTGAPLPSAGATEMTCNRPASAVEVGDILSAALVTERSQPGISITIMTPKTTQWVEFVKPDSFRWKNQAGDVWDESISVGGTAFARSSVQGWTKVPLLDPTAAILMQAFTDPSPKKMSAADFVALFTKAGYTDVKVEGRLVGGLDPAFFGSCIYELIVKSGDRVIYSQKTWIGAADGLRYKFEAMDETGSVMETRLFDYENIKIEVPVP